MQIGLKIESNYYIFAEKTNTPIGNSSGAEYFRKFCKYSTREKLTFKISFFDNIISKDIPTHQI